jgi:hypothetical protein
LEQIRDTAIYKANHIFCYRLPLDVVYPYTELIVYVINGVFMVFIFVHKKVMLDI